MAPGLAYKPGDCLVDDSSDAIVTNAVSLQSAFVGKASGDESNLDGVTATALYQDIGGWLRFERELRGWGLDGGPFPSRDPMSHCKPDATCRIWDWSLPVSDNLLLDALSTWPEETGALLHPWTATTAEACTAIPGVLWESGFCSTPGWTLQLMCEHFGGDWVDPKCASRVLRNASELIGDGQGNENGLCEGGERCQVTPNIGAYQGHGELEHVTTTGGGPPLDSITLLRRVANGY